MNERIIALQKQAYQFADRNTQEGDNQFATVQLGKFAELIIQEMLQTCEEHPGWTGRMIGDKIKEHFGVE